MKKHYRNRFVGPLAMAATVLLLQVLATNVTQARTDVGNREMEQALVNSGFKVQTATTREQRNQIRNLPDNEFTEVKQGGNTFYLYPDKRENRLFAGDHWAFRAYKGYIHNRKLREKGVFVWEVRPADRANNKTVEVWHGWTPFPEWSNSRPNDY